MAENRWRFLDSGPGLSSWNMALDEALLEALSRLRLPVLRFYGWSEQAASFGYFQKYAEVEALTKLRPLVRRPTGGGLVPHARDWTYSIAVPPWHEWYHLAATESYQRVHDWLRLSFVRLGVETELAPLTRKELPGQCFAGHEQSDLLWQGRKIAGAAQRRRRDGLLIQGSVQPPSSTLDRSQWEQAVRAAGEKQYEISWVRLELDEPLAQGAEILARRKYSNPEFIQRR